MTIHQLPGPCFVLDPSPWNDDAGDPHFPTHTEADEELGRLLKEGASERTRIKRLDAPCWVAECDAPDGPEGTCPETLGDEEEGPSCIHFETVKEMFDWMPGEGWVKVFADNVLCGNHNPDNPEPPPLSPDEQEKAGQLAIPGIPHP